MQLSAGGRCSKVIRKFVGKRGQVVCRVAHIVRAADVEREQLAEKPRLSNPAVLIHDRVVHTQQEFVEIGTGFSEYGDTAGHSTVDSAREFEQHVIFGRKVEIEGAACNPSRLRDPVDLRRRKPDLIAGHV